MARYLFKLRKTSCLLMEWSSAMSSGSSRACSIALATWLAFPPWKSLMEALANKGVSSNIKAGSQAGGVT